MGGIEIGYKSKESLGIKEDTKDKRHLLSMLPLLEKVNGLMPPVEGSFWGLLLYCKENKDRFVIRTERDIVEALAHFRESLHEPLHWDINVSVYSQPCLMKFNQKLLLTSPKWTYETAFPVFSTHYVSLRPQRAKEGYSCEVLSKAELLCFAKDTRPPSLAVEHSGGVIDFYYFLKTPHLNRDKWGKNQNELEVYFGGGNPIHTDIRLFSMMPCAPWGTRLGEEEAPTNVLFANPDAYFNEE